MAAKTSKSAAKSPEKTVTKSVQRLEDSDSIVFVRPPKINVSSIELPLRHVIAFQLWCNNAGEPQRAMFKELIMLFLEQNLERLAQDVDKIHAQVINQFENLNAENFPWEAAFLLCLMTQPVKFTPDHIRTAMQAVENNDPYKMSRDEFIHSLDGLPVPFVGGLKPMLSRVSSEEKTI